MKTSQIVEEIVYDLKFIKRHTLQPKWYKYLKIFLLITGAILYYHFRGIANACQFFLCLIVLMTIVHFVYRGKTKRYTKSWLDFRVEHENGARKYHYIGIYYYLTILIACTLSYVIDYFI